MHRWIESYVRNRSQVVTIGKYRSEIVTASSGVPQGSILGPLLYISYLFDIHLCFQHASFLLYADDTKIFMQIKSIDDCRRMQEDLLKLSEYYTHNRINLNINKCNQISFTRNNKPMNFIYQINGTAISKADAVRDLGVLLDSKLSFVQHIESITDKAYKNLGFVLRTCRPFNDIECIKLLYYANVRSVLEYCCQIWAPQYITHAHSIERIQRKFIKHLNYRSQCQCKGYQVSCRKHKLLTLESRRQILDMMFLYNLCNDNVDSTNLVSRTVQLNATNRRTRHTSLFYLPSVHTNYAKNSITYRLRQEYNKHFSKIDIFGTSKHCFKGNLYKHTLFGKI